jgi:hypothetical protein
LCLSWLKSHILYSFRYLYLTLLFKQHLLLLHYIPKENNVLFTPYTLSDSEKYSLHFKCLAGHENGPIHALIKRTSLVIHTISHLADSLNTNALFVHDVWVLECAPGYL